MRPEIIAALRHWGLERAAAVVPTSGAVYVIMYLVLGGLFAKRARIAGLPLRRAIDLWIVAGVGAVVGTRLYWVALHWQTATITARSWFDGNGTASWGVYLGAAVAVAIYSAAERMAPLPWLDMAASVQPVGEAIGRWACVLAGDDFGRVSQVPWAIRFPAGSLAWRAQLASGGLAPDAAQSLPVHPEQFYLMANALLLTLIVPRVWRRTRDRPGVTLGLYLLLYGATRFVIEFFRDPAAGGAVSGLSSSQWMCLAYVAGGTGVLLACKRRTGPRTV